MTVQRNSKKDLHTTESAGTSKAPRHIRFSSQARPAMASSELGLGKDSASDAGSVLKVITIRK